MVYLRWPVAVMLAAFLVLASSVLISATAFATGTQCDTLPEPEQTTFAGRHVVRGSGTFSGTNQDDFIVGSEGRDVIHAKYGNDIVCALGGKDVIYGQESGDDLYGGADDDYIFGGVLDDELYGGPGNDVLIGSHGRDSMDGEAGNDWLRGGTNGDDYIGGSSTNDDDVASFADATPTGAHAGGLSGVLVNLGEEPVSEIRPGEALGSGTDTIGGIETIIGSAFDDEIVTNGNTRHAYGGMGSDSCTPGPCEEPATALSAPFAYLDTYTPLSGASPDPMLSIVGNGAAEAFTFGRSGATFTASASVESAPEELATTGPCTASSGTVTCSTTRVPTAGMAVWFGGAGGDSMTIASGAQPNGMTLDLDGGDDSDTITGNTGSETLYSGNSGTDTLHGGSGPDALITEGTGGDELFGDAGNDQLVTSDPCQGHTFSGGAGTDIAGFARTVPGENGVPNFETLGIQATIGGRAFIRGEAPNSNICAGQASTAVNSDNEILEGTQRRDILNGNSAANTLWGRQNDDELFGLGGKDIIEGEAGEDTAHGGNGDDIVRGETERDILYGDPGRDQLYGGSGRDVFHTRDGFADFIDCGEDLENFVDADELDQEEGCFIIT
jgi:Ca2+-binding RTX toxin-like protein